MLSIATCAVVCRARQLRVKCILSSRKTRDCAMSCRSNSWGSVDGSLREGLVSVQHTYNDIATHSTHTPHLISCYTRYVMLLSLQHDSNPLQPLVLQELFHLSSQVTNCGLEQQVCQLLSGEVTL